MSIFSNLFGSSIPTFQQVLDKSSVLIHDTIITAKNKMFQIRTALTIIFNSNNDAGDSASIQANSDTSDSQVPNVTLSASRASDGKNATLQVTPEGVFNFDGSAAKKFIYVRIEDNFADDIAAGLGGIKTGEGYHDNGIVRIKTT